MYETFHNLLSKRYLKYVTATIRFRAALCQVEKTLQRRIRSEMSHTTAHNHYEPLYFIVIPTQTLIITSTRQCQDCQSIIQIVPSCIHAINFSGILQFSCESVSSFPISFLSVRDGSRSKEQSTSQKSAFMGTHN